MKKKSIGKKLLCLVLTLCMMAGMLLDGRGMTAVRAEDIPERLTLYYCPGQDWIDNGYEIRIGAQDADDGWNWTKMQDTGETVDGSPVYSGVLAKEESYPSGTLTTLQFEAHQGKACKGQVVPFGDGSVDATALEDKFFDGESWTEYVPDQNSAVAADSKTAVSDSSNGTRTVYFDATLSKLSYQEGENLDWGIPAAGSASTATTVYYWAQNSQTKVNSGAKAMTLMPSETVKGQVWDSVYEAKLDEGYDQIIFAANPEISGGNLGWCGDSTALLDLPTEYSSPCFYADSGDDVVYGNSSDNQRGGVWGEVHTVQDPEHKTGTAVVDIPSDESFQEDSDTLYVDSSFYDYYTDYELNGKNRDNYNDQFQTSYRYWYPFRQLNQALSSYYLSKEIQHPLYEGHFQPNGIGGSEIGGISGALALYGYDNYPKFISQNNSIFDYDGNGGKYGCAAQGLVADALKDGKLQILSTDERAAESTANSPFFDENFLTGENSKHTVLGKVYHNVSFPFTKKKVDVHGIAEGDEEYQSANAVTYWWFDSKKTTLRMQSDASNGNYYLAAKDGETICNTDSSSNSIEKNGFFPFNTEAQGAQAARINYGYGMKMEFKFRLTENGMIAPEGGAGGEVPIKFNFSGDDDVWVYIDGKLVLDIGGAHGQVDGNIDFSGSEKHWSVSGAKNAGTGKQDGSGTFTLSGSGTEEHTLTMFYMERGMWESNLKVTFNFPDANRLEVEKEVDASEVRDIFQGYFETNELLTFPFKIQNLATSGDEKEAGGEQSAGFRVKQEDIPTYGSIVSKKLEPAEGARYTLSGGSAEPASSGEVEEDGTFALCSGQTATFNDQFRRGSYIYLEEKVNADVFSTTWTMYNDGQPVTEMGTGDTVTNPSEQNLVGRSGKIIEDNRQETDQFAKIRTPKQAALFRSYENPDSESVFINLKAKYVNTVRTGGLVIAKEEASGSESLDGIDYKFQITFSNIAGMQLEGDDKPELIKFTLRAGGDPYEIEGIPAGTQYVIEELPSEDGTAFDHADATDKGNDSDLTIDSDQAKITGYVTADETPDTYSKFTFYNMKTRLENFSFSFTKVRKEEGEEAVGKLAGAEFTLYQYTGAGQAPEEYSDFARAIQDMTPGRGDWQVILMDADEEQVVFRAEKLDRQAVYYLVETKVPDGMQSPEGCWVISYQDSGEDVHENVQITPMKGSSGHMPAIGYLETANSYAVRGWFITNLSQWSMPGSGGRGAGIFRTPGVILLAFAAAGGMMEYHRRKKSSLKIERSNKHQK